MTATIIISLSLCSTLMFPLMSQPLSLGLFIMISTLLMCAVAAMTLSAWYSYILFLIYVGGLLVMFAYVAALSPNVLFKGSYSLLFLLTMTFLFSFILYFYPFLDFGMLSYSSEFSLTSYMKTYGTQLVSPHTTSILVGLGIILLLNLVVVVKICYYQHSSLRPFQAE